MLLFRAKSYGFLFAEYLLKMWKADSNTLYDPVHHHLAEIGSSIVNPITNCMDMYYIDACQWNSK